MIPSCFLSKSLRPRVGGERLNTDTTPPPAIPSWRVCVGRHRPFWSGHGNRIPSSFGCNPCLGPLSDVRSSRRPVADSLRPHCANSPSRRPLMGRNDEIGSTTSAELITVLFYGACTHAHAHAYTATCHPDRGQDRWLDARLENRDHFVD